MVGIRRIIPLRVEHPKPLVAVVIPPELGLQLMHLSLVLDQVEGAVVALRVPSHLGNQIFYSVDLDPRRLCSQVASRQKPRGFGPENPLEESLGDVICQLNRLKHNYYPLHWEGGIGK